MEALVWRGVLEEVDEDRRGERFQSGELSSLARGAGLDLEELEIEQEEVRDAPLVLRFRASVSGLGVSQGGGLAVPAALAPMNLGLGYTQLPRRWSGLLIPYAPVQEATVRFEIEGGRVRELPAELSLSTEHGSFRRVVRGRPGDATISLETRSTLRPGVVRAREYGKLRELTAAIQAAEQAVLRVE
jgi:hypothetical protein